jgi:F-type H+-transporting ATPase subunit delta
MHAASRDSYAVGLERLEELAANSEPAAVATGADEVLAVADLLRREPRLRRALSDPARSGKDRAGMLGSLLAGKVGPGALDLLTALVAGRWSTPTELLDATEQLGAEGLLISAERSGDLAEVEDELFRFGQIVNGDHRLAAALGDSSAPLERRIELVGFLLEGKAKPVTIRLAALALAGFGGRNLAGSLTRLVELAAERRDREVAYVTVAAPLTDEDERRLGVRLSELYGRGVSLKISVDPGILGGLSVRVGHDLYDGTVLRRLQETRNALAGR